ncbi:hypothetical protein ABW21_db0200470 [Orbilia brochopaga]|nr:hypothetical protein ABW21_db0200470 [Drechslerella brochopaga]
MATIACAPASRTRQLRLLRRMVPIHPHHAGAVRRSTPRTYRLPLIQLRLQSTGGTGGGSDYQLGPSQDVQPQPNTQSWGDAGERDNETTRRRHRWKQTAYRMLESAATTGASLAILGYYKNLVLQKINNAFEPGDPVLDLATAGRGASSVVPGGTVKEWQVPTPPDSELRRLVCLRVRVK